MKSLTPILLIGVSVGLFYLYIDPQYTAVKELSAQKVEYVNALEKARDLQNVRDELLTRYNALPKENIAKLERLIPDNLNTVKLVADIDSVAGKYGIPIRAVKVTEEMVDESQRISTEFVEKPYKVTTISMKAAATFESLLPFLQDLEKSLQLIDVRSVTFTADDGLNNGINDYDISIVTYSLR
jgi:Tfp pilus assembly protein PilO